MIIHDLYIKYYAIMNHQATRGLNEKKRTWSEPPFLSRPASNPTSSFQWGSRPKERSLSKKRSHERQPWTLSGEGDLCHAKTKSTKKTNKHNEQVSSIYCREWWTKSTKEQQTYSNIQLVGGIPNPLNNMSSSVGIMKFPTEWKVIKFHGSSHHQLE